MMMSAEGLHFCYLWMECDRIQEKERSLFHEIPLIAKVAVPDIQLFPVVSS
jgi:hypothetical protein